MRIRNEYALQSVCLIILAQKMFNDSKLYFLCDGGLNGFITVSFIVSTFSPTKQDMKGKQSQQNLLTTALRITQYQPSAPNNLIPCARRKWTLFTSDC